MTAKAQTNFLEEIIVDGFAGGGGWSTGIELATGAPVDIAINHDPDAILMHKTNHPYTQHYCESIYDVDPRKAVAGRPVGWAHFSPDCKHFSKAKGGKPIDKKIRGLAWVVLRWAGMVRPRIISLENVEEFKTWGPVRRGRPVKSRKGETFKRFVSQLSRLGYRVEWRELRACDYGAPTIRKRFFLMARCDGKPIVWPKPTHGDPKSPEVQSGQLQPWRTAAEVIDWSIPCPSIFERKRPLAENTMRRIARGIQKFVIDNPEPFIVQVNHGGDGFRGQGMDAPLQTITAKHGYGVVTPVMAAIGQTGFSGDRTYSPAEPVRTIVSKAEQCLVTPTLIKYHGEKGAGDVQGQDIGAPLQTVDTSNRYGLIAANLVTLRNNMDGRSAKMTLDTLTTKDHSALVAAHICKLKGTNIGQPADEPLQTITAGGTHFAEVRAFLIKYYGQGTGQATDRPLDTVTAQDRFGLVTIHGTDYQIVDIGMRMLTPRELYNAQGFPLDYIIERDYTGKSYPKSKQVARCGNAVPPPFATALVRANWAERCAGLQISTMEALGKKIAI